MNRYLVPLACALALLPLSCIDDDCARTATCPSNNPQGGGGTGGTTASTGGAAGQGGMSTSSQGGSTSVGTGGQGGGSPTGFPSCQGRLMCGSDSCCTQVELPGGTFFMGRGENPNNPDYYASGLPNEIPEHNATVDAFSIDKFEVTVGRFREFVSQYAGEAPAAGAGAHPLVAGSGWQSAWDAMLPASQALLKNDLACGIDGAVYTWTSLPGPNENRPINCVNWYEAYAFCIWDGGRLPTEAEWEIASAGINDRLYSWGGAPPSTSRLAYECLLVGDDSCEIGDIAEVGSLPLGATPEGIMNLAGNVREWLRDHYTSDYYQTGACDNCINLIPSVTSRVLRGATYFGPAEQGRSAARSGQLAGYNAESIGFRCVHQAQ